MTGGETALLMAILGIGSGAASGVASSIGNRKNAELSAKTQKEIAEMEIADAEAARLLNTAMQESLLDPFRHQMNQAGDLARLDLMERASFRPTRFAADPRYGQPLTASGGFAYEMSPEIRRAARDLKTSVLAGRGAPTMTDPSNYGRTSVLDLLRVASGGTRADTDDAFATGAPWRPGMSTTRQAGGARTMPVRTPRVLDRYSY